MPDLGQARHHVEHLVDHLGVQGRGGLVEEHDLGVHRQASGDRHPLLLAAGQLGRVLVGLSRATPTRSSSSLGLWLGLGLALLADLDRAERDVLEDRLVREEVEGLEHHADVGAQLGQRLALVGQRSCRRW
jgi:hypothetical protein